jgi:hypothetical protein
VWIRRRDHLDDVKARADVPVSRPDGRLKHLWCQLGWRWIQNRKDLYQSYQVGGWAVEEFRGLDPPQGLPALTAAGPLPRGFDPVQLERLVSPWEGKVLGAVKSSH